MPQGVNMIERLGLFRELDEAEKKKLSDLLHLRDVKPGEIVYREGDPGGNLNFVTKGKVNVCKITMDGEQYCMVSLTEGEMFGIMSFLDGSPHDATIIADMETQLMTMKKDDFDALVLTDCPLAWKVLRNLAAHLARIIRNMNSQYMDLMQYMFKKG
jgi:CRP-like cAMP-binding protein